MEEVEMDMEEVAAALRACLARVPGQELVFGPRAGTAPPVPLE